LGLFSADFQHSGGQFGTAAGKVSKKPVPEGVNCQSDAGIPSRLRPPVPQIPCARARPLLFIVPAAAA
jgi:hypothetical protein